MVRKLPICVLFMALTFSTFCASGGATPGPVPPTLFSHWQKLLTSSLTIAKVSPAVGNELTNSSTTRYWTSCFQGTDGAKNLNPCHFGDTASRTKVVLLGDSFAGEWVPALDQLGKSMHFEVIGFVRYGCPFFDLPVRENATTPFDPGCLTYRKAATVAANALHPNLVVFSQNLYKYHANGSALDPGSTPYTESLTRSIAKIHAEAKVMFYGFIYAKSDPAVCLSRNLNAVQNCSTPTDMFFSTYWFSAFAKAATLGGAYPVGLTQLSCNITACPSVVGGHIVHLDQGHFMADFAKESAPALGQLIGCAATDFPRNSVLDLLLQTPASSAAAWCASNESRLGHP